MHQVTIQQGNYTIDRQILMSICNRTQLVFPVSQTIPSITITYWHTRWCIDLMHWYQEKNCHSTWHALWRCQYGKKMECCCLL